MKKHVIFFALLMSVLSSRAQIEFTQGEGQVFWTDALPHEDGTFTVAGTVLSGGKHFMVLARYLADGAPDCSFQNQGFGELTIRGDWEYLVRIEPVADGKIIALFHPPDTARGLTLARFYRDGFLDRSFGRNGILQIAEDFPVHYVALKRQADGKLLAAGFMEGPEPACVIRRLLPDGTPDPSFLARIPSPGGQDFHMISLAPLPNGNTLVAVYCSGRLVLLRLLENGAQDLSFGEAGFVVHPIAGFRPYDLLLPGDTAWIAVGAGQLSDEGWPVAVKGRADGSLDHAFGNGGVLYAPKAFEAASAGMTDANGNLMMAGVAERAERTGYFILRRLLANGTPDETFGDNGYLAPAFEEPCFQGTGVFIRRLADGRLLAGGGVNLKGALVCLGTDGRPDPAFGNNGMVISVMGGNNPLDIDCSNLLFLEGGKIMATGSVNKPFDSEILAIRLESDGALDSSFFDHGYVSVHLPNPVRGVDAALQKDGKLVVGGEMRASHKDHTNLDFGVCRLNPDGSLDTTFGKRGVVTLDCGFYDILGAVDIQKDGKILVAGDMDNPETLDRMLVVYRLQPSGKRDLAFGVDGFCAIEHLIHGSFASLMQQQDGKILLLDAHPPRGFDIVRILPNGIPDGSFGEGGLRKYSFRDAPAPLQSLMGAVTAGDRLLIAGQMGEKAGVMSLDPEGEVDTGFGENGIVYLDLPQTAWEMAVLRDGKFLLAGSGCSDNAPFNYFFGARFLPEGRPDTLFGENGLLRTGLPAYSVLTSLLPRDDGTVLLGGKGYTSESDSHSDILLIRYLAELDAGHLCPKHQFPFLDVYPYAVPAGEFSLSFDLPVQNNVVVTLLDEEGNDLGILLDACRPEGRHSEKMTFPSGLPPGHYRLRVKTDQVETTVRILHSGR